MTNIKKRLDNLETAVGTGGIEIHVMIDGADPAKLDAARKAAKASGKILVPVSLDDMRL